MIYKEPSIYKSGLGLQEVIDEIKKGFTDGIGISQQQQQGGGGGDSLEKVPWDIPQDQQ